ncbi:MAG: hypothetical protein QOH74_2160, partial [Gaiellales bacterium]|nr:hypothetical protein [Gaiellales bacterium]
KEVAADWSVSRQTLHTWLARYEPGGLEGLADRSHRPDSCPHQMPAAVEATVLELRRTHGYWGPHRLMVELARKGVNPVPSESAVYRCLVRAGVIEPARRQRRKDSWRRWERGRPMELWQSSTWSAGSQGAGHRLPHRGRQRVRDLARLRQPRLAGPLLRRH